MGNSIIDAVEGLESLKKYWRYDGGPVFVYDADGKDISSSVNKLVCNKGQSTVKIGENTEKKIAEPSIVDRLLQLFRSFPRRK